MGIWKYREDVAAFLIGIVLSIFVAHESLSQGLQFNEVAFEEWYLDDGEEWGNGWIEIKNTSGGTVSTNGLSLTLNNNEPWQFPDTVMEANQYLLVWLSGKNRNSPGTVLHASFTITDAHNVFTIRNEAINITVDSINVVEKMYWNESRIRYPENSENWYNSNLRTPSSQNPSPGPWKRLASQSRFSPRDSAPNAALFYQNKLWIMEGWSGGGGEESASSNVWVSLDGSAWESINDSPPYHPYSSYIVFKDKMWALDGSAYSSTDGVEWIKVAEHLPFTTNNRVAELDGKLFVVAGKSIYESPDGISWQKVGEAPWEVREFPALVKFKNALWFYGGGIDYGTGYDYYFNDVWSSTDGVTWNKVVEHAQWRGRLWFGFASFDDKMWMMGGWNYHELEDEQAGNKNDVWYTEDGIAWKSLNTSNIWQPRHAPLVWSSPDALLLSSGYLNNVGLFNDVWRLDRAENIIANSYYLKSGEEPNATSSWGTSIDGTGFSPSNFSNDYQRFVITNQDTVRINRDFIVTGQSSYILLGNGSDPIYAEVGPYVTIDAEVKLSGNATLGFQGSQVTPRIESIDEKSTVIIGDRTALAANSIGQLIITGNENFLIRSTFIKKSVKLVNGGAIRSDSAILKYAPLSSLFFESSTNHRVSRAEWPRDTPPTSVTISCGCIISRRGSTSTDSLTFINGRMEITHGVLSAKHISNANEQSYVITGVDGFVETIVSSEQTLFPVGTVKSYNPIDITLLEENDTEHYFRASTFDANDIDDPEYSVQVGYNVLYGTPDVPPYEVTFHWNADNEGKFLDPNYLVLVKPNEETATTNTTFYQRNADITIDNENKNLSSKLYDAGTYFVKDGRFMHATDDVLIFPNPSVDHIFLLFNSAQEARVNLQVLDLSGNPVYTEDLETGNRIYTVNWHANIPSGLYLLRLDDGRKTVVKKMVIR